MKYGNLVQSKRRKMLFLVLLLVVYPFFNVSAINLTYIIKKDNGVIKPSCIAEELERYAAIGWIYPLRLSTADFPNITTKYTPTYNNDFNCKFSKNSLCTTRWSIRDWKVDENSIRTHDAILDSRWEDFTTISVLNSSKEFEGDKLEVNGQTSFSVRAQGVVEIFICSGWDPHNYPCHYFNFNDTDVFYKQYPIIPKDIKPEHNASDAEHYKTIKNVLSLEEWRTFNIHWGDKSRIILTDVTSNVPIINRELKDSEHFDPVYMFMRSATASLWKFHHNDFFFANSTQISRFGPQLTLNNRDLCISFYIRTCGTCEATFFYQNFPSPRKILKRIGPTNDQWIEIKIKEENTLYEKVNLFIETKLLNSSNSGYWAIDDVRICHENEVKITYLRFSNATSVNEADISCQLIEKPSLRPKQLIYNSIPDFPEITSVSNSTSITLKWEQEDPKNEISYFITYKGNDLCMSEPHNLKRIKSNGFLWTKVNEITISDLVPYTLYNVSIETVLHQNGRVKRLHTTETVEPTYEERPLNIQIRPMDNRINVTWEKVKCSDVYGRLVYNLVVTNPTLNFSKTVSLQTDNSYLITGLRPFTDYTLNIIAGRNGRSIYSGNNVHAISYNFTTSPGISPPVQDLEVYAIDTNVAYLRFGLPEDPQGVAKEVQIMKCNALSFFKCKTYFAPLRPCSLWKNKYCIDISNLTPNSNYAFKVSLKNKGTNMFGEEVSVKAFTSEKVPGNPGNITYRIVDCHVSTDYCNLNVTWLHPYMPNGTITEFHIILNSTDMYNDSEEDTTIHEIYKVENKTYYPFYTYQIKYLPYSRHYNLFIQSANRLFKSDYTQRYIKTDNIGDHIDQHPKLLGKSHSTFIFKLPLIDRRLDHYNLTVVVQDYNNSAKIDHDLMKKPKIANNLCHNFGETWISDFVRVTSNDSGNLMIGDLEKHSLKPNAKYCITFIISNKYANTEHDVVYYEKLKTSEAPVQPKEASGSNNHLYLLLILLILIPIGFLVYRYMSKRRMIPSAHENTENVYETLPFEECDSNAVSNENYDRLVHK